jgi:methionyl-tRNA formyltransferase
LKILFLGTADFACPSLEALLASSHELVGVVTQPDRPKGRGRKVAASPVKSLALVHGIPLHQPEKIRDPASLELLKGFHADLFVVVAYGQILSPDVLAIPPRGSVNVHASLLPRYRGAAPIARALLAGESRTGVTTMLLDPGMDTGPTLLVAETPISAEETSATLHDRLAHLGAHLLIKTLEGLETGAISPRPQDHSLATYAPKVEKEEGRIDWARPAGQLFNLIRAFDPWPGAFTSLEEKGLKVFRPVLLPEEASVAPGTVIRTSPAGLEVAAVCGRLLLREVQLENRPRMNAAEFLRGTPLKPGTRFGGR